MQATSTQQLLLNSASKSLLNKNHDSDSSVEQNSTLDLSDLTLIEEIGASKATVFLAHLPSHDKYVAAKMFTQERRRPNKYFVNEIKFSHLQHPNIISVMQASAKTKIAVSQDCSVTASAIVMELATYGDFLSVLVTHQIFFEAKLARTYFHQLISAMEYMHSNGVAHQDLKLDNLLLGDSFQLKICDFDVAWKEGDVIPQEVGTSNYRAPEVCSKTCSDPKKVDIYSAGVLLFLFKCGGALPHLEDQLYGKTDLRDLLYNNNEAFWEKHCEIQDQKTAFFDEDFKQLFNGMICADAAKRFTIEQVKSSKWYQGEIFTKRELISVMRRKISSMTRRSL